MLGRGNIAEKVSPGRPGDGTADGTGDVIVAWRYIGHQRSQHVERGTMAEPLLELDVGLDLIQRHMARSLDHDLYTGIPGPLSQFPQNDQLLDLGPVGGIGQATGTEAVTQ